MSNEELVMKIQAGETEYMEQLYHQVKRFIYKIAMKYQVYENVEDLAQEGYLGLYAAVEKYRPEEGANFITYAGYWIKQSIGRYLENNGHTIRIPTHRRQEIIRYKKFVAKYMAAYQKEPSMQEIAWHMGVSVRVAEEIRGQAYRDKTHSVNEVIGDDLILGDIIADPTDVEGTVIDEVAAGQLKEELWSLVDDLEEKQCDVIRKRYLEEMTLREVAEQEGVAIENIRQRQEKGMRRLRKNRRIKELGEEFDFIQSHAYRGSVGRFRDTWTSSTEYTALKMMEC